MESELLGALFHLDNKYFTNISYRPISDKYEIWKISELKHTKYEYDKYQYTKDEYDKYQIF